MNCPYCGTENPADAKNCSHCSADLTSLPTGAPPPESVAPTMMSSSAEVAAMLAAAKAEQETAADSSSEPEMQPEASAFAPTMISAVPAEVAEAIAAAQASASSEEAGEEATEPDLEPVAIAAEAPEVEVPSSSFAPTMISAVPEEVAAVIAEAKEQHSDAEPAEAADPTVIGIPDPLGITDVEEAAPPEPAPAFKETPTPFFNEPVKAPPVAPASPSETPAGDNRRMWIIGGIGGCLVLCCLCSMVFVAISYLPSLLNSF